MYKLFYKQIAILFLFWFAVNFAYAQTNSPPKLVVGIVIEQMRYDYFARFGKNFDDDGFKKIIKEGIFCKNTQFDCIINQTASGYATIATGCYPNAHGIIADEWYDRRKKNLISCTADKRQRAVGSSSEKGNCSPRLLVAPTLADELKMATNGRSRVVSISMRENAAILSGGKKPDGAFWFDDRSGRWITSDYYMKSLPAWVNDFNAENIPSISLTKEWTLLLSPDKYADCLPDENPYEKGYLGLLKKFPHDLQNLNRRTREFSIFAQTPQANAFTKDFAIAAIESENLGKDDTPDLLMVSFSTAGYLADAFPPNSVEIADVFYRLDQNIAALVQYLEKNIGKENFLLYITSDHGVDYSYEYLKENNYPTGKFNYKVTNSLLVSLLKNVHGRGDYVKFYTNSQFYLNRNFIEEKKKSLKHFQEISAEFIADFQAVSEVMPSFRLEQNYYPEGIYRKMKNSYYPKRSGDLFINLHPGWKEDLDGKTSYSNGYEALTHVPLLWYGWRIKPKRIARKIEPIDIAPTISNILGITAPAAATGNIIEEVAEPEN